MIGVVLKSMTTYVINAFKDFKTMWLREINDSVIRLENRQVERFADVGKMIKKAIVEHFTDVGRVLRLRKIGGSNGKRKSIGDRVSRSI